jgi:hypothetical protein
MAEAKTGREFITHEFDEAIAIQQALVTAEESLARVHPIREAAQALRASATEDTRFLRELQRLGKPFGATGKAEEIAAAMQQLAEESSSRASEAASEAYEAHAVVVTLKRKQQDSGAAMLKIARAQRNTELRDAANEFFRAQKAGAQTLADSLAAFAVVIATQESEVGAGPEAASTQSAPRSAGGSTSRSNGRAASGSSRSRSGSGSGSSRSGSGSASSGGRGRSGGSSKS